MIEVHKRFDPMYADARDRIRGLGDFGYMNAYMSQPKMQLETFKAWAGKASDISYYLNSHHIDFHEVSRTAAWPLGGRVPNQCIRQPDVALSFSVVSGRPCSACQCDRCWRQGCGTAPHQPRHRRHDCPHRSVGDCVDGQRRW